MTPADILRMHGMCAYSIDTNLDGMTHEESLIVPRDGGNSANWIYGHILRTRETMFRIAGTSVPTTVDLAAYDRGTGAVTPNTATPLDTLRTIDQQGRQALASLLKDAGDSLLVQALEQPNGFLGSTVGDALASFSFHEAYHAGQLGVARRAAGRRDGGIA